MIQTFFAVLFLILGLSFTVHSVFYEKKNLLFIIVEIHHEHLLAQNIHPIEIYEFLQKFDFLAKQITPNKSLVLFTKKQIFSENLI